MKVDELKAHLLAEAEKAIDEVLAEKPAAGNMSLADIEHLALKSGAQMETSVLKALGNVEAEADQTVERICERCGSRMQRRGVHRRQVLTEAGPTTVERAYQVCPGCGASLFPPG